MIWKNTLKYPVLTIGIILFVLYLSDPKTTKFWKNYKRGFIPSTCDAVLDRVVAKTPSHWELECPGTQRLIVNITHDATGKSEFKLRKDMFKELANSYVNLARFSNPETMAILQVVEINMVSDDYKIHSKTDGQAVAELLLKKSQAAIAKHIQLTIKVKEIR